MTAPAEDPRGGEAKHAGIVREATDLCWKATPFTEDETGAVAAYLLPAGVVHRLLGQLQGAGYPAAFRAIAAPPAAGRGDTDSGGEVGRSIAASQAECDIAEVLHTHPAVTWADALDLAARVLAARPAGDRAQPTQELRVDLVKRWTKEAADREAMANRLTTPSSRDEMRRLRDRATIYRRCAADLRRALDGKP